MANVAELRRELSNIFEAEQTLTRRRNEITLAIEEAEGRPDSHEARFARAYLADDSAAMARLVAEDDAAYFKKHGRWTTHQQQAEEILSAEKQP